MNAVFNLKMEVTVGENLLTGVSVRKDHMNIYARNTKFYTITNYLFNYLNVLE